MTKLALALKCGVLALCLTALALGTTAAFQGSAYADHHPQPQCGPTRQWICVVPGCPTCPDILLEGTICEKEAFEKKTGRVCSPI